MPKLRVHNFSVSVDGFAAGPEQDLAHPVGVDGTRLHEWLFATRAFADLPPDGTAARNPRGVDDGFIAAGEVGIGATIMGRNMFGPIRGPWPDLTWTGWWGEDPPYHHPVFVLTHHPRPAVTMAGGTVFHFVDPGRSGGIGGVLDEAFAAAGGEDVRLGGGAATISQFLRAELVDELHLAVVPVLLGRGERLFGAADAVPGAGSLPGYQCRDIVSSGSVVHVRFAATPVA